MIKIIRPLLITGFFFSAHFALVSYINSTTLSQYFPEKYVGLLFTVGSLLSVLLLALFPSVLRKIGVKKALLSLFSIAAAALFVLGFLKIPLGIGAAFVLYFSLNASILYCLDIFIEHYSTEENTGNIRGIYLAAVNSAWVISPLIAGLLISRFGYDIVYIIAAILFIPAGVAVYTSQKKFHDAVYEKESFVHAIRLAFKNPPVRRILFLSFLLHFFFVWMVIYLPILLTKTMGIPWDKTGILFTAMLLPFIIFQYPAGVLADKRLGEKELLIFGFLVAGLATLIFALHGDTFSFLQIAIVLFLTRVGASIIEIMCDTYFFKQIQEKDSTLVSLYRSMMPFGYVIGPTLGSLYLLKGGSITGIFIILGVMMLTAIPYTLLLKDTK